MRLKAQPHILLNEFKAQHLQNGWEQKCMVCISTEGSKEIKLEEKKKKKAVNFRTAIFYL